MTTMIIEDAEYCAGRTRAYFRMSGAFFLLNLQALPVLAMAMTVANPSASSDDVILNGLLAFGATSILGFAALIAGSMTIGPWSLTDNLVEKRAPRSNRFNLGDVRRATLTKMMHGRWLIILRMRSGKRRYLPVQGFPRDVVQEVFARLVRSNAEVLVEDRRSGASSKWAIGDPLPEWSAKW